MDILHRLQKLPIKTRKLILWLVVILLGFSLLTWWAKSIQKRLESFRAEELIESLEVPEIEMPKIETQELNEEFKKLKEILETAEQYGEPR